MQAETWRMCPSSASATGSASGPLKLIFLLTSHSVVSVSAHLQNVSRVVLPGLRFTMLETNYFILPLHQQPYLTQLYHYTYKFRF